MYNWCLSSNTADRVLKWVLKSRSDKHWHLIDAVCTLVELNFTDSAEIHSQIRQRAVVKCAALFTAVFNSSYGSHISA